MENLKPQNTAPVKAAFICLVLAWVMALLPIPFISMGGMVVFNIIAFILAIICMAKDEVKKGGLVLAGTIIVTPLMYFMGYALIGLFGASALIGASALSGHSPNILNGHNDGIQNIRPLSNFTPPSNQVVIDPSGKWEGKFTYPKGVETSFTMSMTTTWNSLSGNLTETDPKTNQPVNSTISGSINNHRQIHFTQNFGTQYPKAKCNADFEAASKSMTGKCAAAGQSASFTAHML